MPQFRYRAITSTGEIVNGEVDAPSRAEVLQRIKYLGHLPIEAELAVQGLLQRSSAATLKPPPARDVTIFLRQLALLLKAGLTLEIALQTLAEDSGKALERFATSLRSGVQAGEGFADTLERHPTIIEPTYIAMVRAGEASGKLEAVLHAIVDDRSRREILAGRISSALQYPCFLVGSAVLILFCFLIFVVPQFGPVFQELGGKLNGGAATMLVASTWLRANLALFFGSVAAAIAVIYLILRDRGRRGQIVTALGTIPGVAGTVRDRRSARIIGTLGLLVDNGVPLPATLKILRDIVSDPRDAEAIDRVHDQVRNGRRFADALADGTLLPPLAVRMLRVGDETGDLGSIARHAADFYEHRLALGLDRLMGAIGPATIIFVSVLIGALVVSIMTALLSITELAL